MGSYIRCLLYDSSPCTGAQSSHTSQTIHCQGGLSYCLSFPFVTFSILPAPPPLPLTGPWTIPFASWLRPSPSLSTSASNTSNTSNRPIPTTSTTASSTSTTTTPSSSTTD